MTRVLVVDDSAFARKVVREVLSREADLEVVGVARDGLDALEKILELRPDVVTLDLMMPELGGIGVLEALAQRPDAPRVVVVSAQDDETPLGIAALEAGAVDVVHKPTALATDRLYALGGELIAKVRAAAVAAPARRVRAEPASLVAVAASPSVDLVVIGASTGGPHAVSALLAALPKSLPVPIAAVLHMPIGYTASYADRVDRESALDVLEARDGLELVPGRVALARAGMHLVLERGPSAPVARLAIEPLDTFHRPSVDVLFTSAARAYGSRVLGVVMTGMGSDGLEGARALRAAGARVLVEAEESCVVYGMPRAVAEAGLANAQVALAGLPAAIVHAVTSAAPGS